MKRNTDDIEFIQKLYTEEKKRIDINYLQIYTLRIYINLGRPT